MPFQDEYHTLTPAQLWEKYQEWVKQNKATVKQD